MRIERVVARAFGPFQNQVLELGPGLSVVAGPNESGKSTWHAALRLAITGLRGGKGSLLDQTNTLQTEGVAAFYDTGNAFDDWHQFDPVNGYGAGVRWRSPVGALSLDLAYGEEARSFRVHFSAGFAFR